MKKYLPEASVGQSEVEIHLASPQEECEPGHSSESVDHGPNRLLLSLAFGQAGNAATHQFGRWSHPEDGFTWGLAPGCGLRIPAAACSGNVAVLVDVQPAWIHPGRRSRRVVVSLEDEILLDLQVSRRGTYLIAVGSFPDGAVIDLQFHFDEVPPFDERETRPLGLAFRRVLVVAQEYKPGIRCAGRPAIPLPMERHRLLEAVAEHTGLEPDTLVTAFESLGHSCDFGLFQRECGAEPLGLLRFSGISTPDLIDALVGRFSMLGAAGNVTASTQADWGGEYMVVDQAYGLVSHTFVRGDQAAPEQLVAREVWRLPFLKRLFREVMDGALKIFVLRRPDEMHVSEALAVAAALRLHGDNVVLWAVDDGGLQPGSIEFILPHLILGQLDTTSGKGSASIQAWLSICLNAYLALGGDSRQDESAA